MGKFIDGEYVSDYDAARRNGTNSYLDSPPDPVYEEPKEHKFSKRVFNWLKEKRTRVIPAQQAGIVPDTQVIKNANESIVWEKETIKKGPAYKLVHTTKLVKLSDFEEIVESEQNIVQELGQLNVAVSDSDWSQINDSITPVPPARRYIPPKKLIPTQMAMQMYPPPTHPKPSVIKSNPYTVSTSNLIPLGTPMYYSTVGQ